MIGIAWVCGYLMRCLRQPVVLGELIGGILIGPTVLGSFLPDTYAVLFPNEPTIVMSRDALLKVGMLFFMFAAGLEVNLAALRRHKLTIALTSVLGGVVPFALGFGTVLLLPDLWGNKTPSFTLALFMGTALSISALPVIARILMDIHLIHRDIGITIMAAAMINDLFGWSLFAMILSSLGQGEQTSHLGIALVFALSILIVALGCWVIQPLLRRFNFFRSWPGGLLAVLSMLVFLAAVCAEKLGIHAIFGAFLVGVALSQSADPEQEQYIHQMVQPFALSFFAPLYFVSVGLKVNFSTNFDGMLVLLVIFIASLGKILGCGLGARIGGMSTREALAVGVGLNARGAIEIILASVALETHLISPRIFVALVVMALVTSMLSGPLLQRLVK